MSRHRRPRPRFKKGNLVRGDTELLLRERGISFDQDDLQVERYGGCIHTILLRGQIIGEYNHVHRKIRIYADEE